MRPTALATDRVPTFDAGDLFGDGEGEKTIVTAVPYELRPRFTGRMAALATLRTAFERAVAERTLAFAVVVGEPGMGKSRLVAELRKAATTIAPTAKVWAGAAELDTAYGAIVRLLGARFGLVAGEPEA
ncbi:MAG: AAA family ATPase, partial [Deltaproteobacteria bacterium]|nr:AAA family ATPase [Deltaproteobacteria bacterium]